MCFGGRSFLSGTAEAADTSAGGTAAAAAAAVAAQNVERRWVGSWRYFVLNASVVGPLTVILGAPPPRGEMEHYPCRGVFSCG